MPPGHSDEGRTTAQRQRLKDRTFGSLHAHFYDYIITKVFLETRHADELRSCSKTVPNSIALMLLRSIVFNRHYTSKTKRGIVLRASDEGAPRTST